MHSLILCALLTSSLRLLILELLRPVQFFLFLFGHVDDDLLSIFAFSDMARITHEKDNPEEAEEAEAAKEGEAA